ncbi:type I-E CRISPR-associated protein Cas5/CasD [Schaalia sp. ZJ1691]|uniref:type I-E CRISPR-associated protein Cas5/CasD n=1 Tax=Schaalia sp. ZJ1691 TaxID=2709404 RepID=UPI0013EBD649|nr:type I-E CRISPR-associated protein Cas5/CasD [Schaalia sp. ZJ1691]
MAVLLLQLSGPMQSWGVKSRFTVRETEHAPSKSGIIGLIAAAKGIRRTEPLEEYLTLNFGVRKDQPGKIISDFQTARSFNGKESMPLSTRYYISDAVFIAGIEGDDNLIKGIDEALRNPVFPLYLGRRSCPPSQPIPLHIEKDKTLFEALRTETWHASERFKRKNHGSFQAEILIDQEAVPTTRRSQHVLTTRDVPLSFNPERRDYAFRNVERLSVILGEQRIDPHDPLSAIEEA